MIWPKTVGGVTLTSQLLTNGQMDEHTGHGMPISHLRANAGGTKVMLLSHTLTKWGSHVVSLVKFCPVV